LPDKRHLTAHSRVSKPVKKIRTASLGVSKNSVVRFQKSRVMDKTITKAINSQAVLMADFKRSFIN